MNQDDLGLIQAGGGVVEREDSAPLLNLMPPEEVESVIKWQFNPDELLERFYYDLLGMVFDERRNKWVVKYAAKINEEGARSVITILRPHVSKVVTLSQFKEEEVNRIVREAYLSLLQDLFVNMERYDLTVNNANIVLSAADHLILASLNGALRGGNRNLLSRGVRHVESYSQQGSDNGKSRVPFLSGLSNVFR